MTWVDDLCRSLAPVDPGFAASIEPATPADMARFAALIGRDIPEDYSRFLSAMGNNDGGLFYVERADTRISKVIAYCERLKAAGRVLDPDRCIPIAIGADFGGFCLTGGADPTVALMEGLDPEEIVFPGLPAMVFAKGFFFEMAATGGRFFVKGLAGETAESLVGKYLAAGYQQEWFSFETKTYLRRDAMLAVVAARNPERPTVELGGRDEASIARALSDLRAMVRNFEHRELRQKTLPEIRDIYRQVGWS